MNGPARLFCAALLAAFLPFGDIRLDAQQPAAAASSITAPDATREGLRALLASLEEAASSESHAAERARARRDAERLRERLRHGDFEVGDPVLLWVEGEEALSDTLLVSSGRVLVVAGIGEISLEGVLLSELDAHLATALGKYLRDPVVRATALIRLGIAGEVQAPGFYVLPRDALVTEALMAAGGPTRQAKVDGVRVERGRDRLWDAKAVRAAIADGRTLAQFDLRPGDRLVVPRESTMTGAEWLRILLLAIPTAVVALTQF
jgi:protein involved in polysaccharide export with SLBB domain